MNLKNLSDDGLIESLKSRVNKEREILIEILYHLMEVERRRLFSKFKFKSLFEYAVKELGYSEDQAYRRISAMRLMKGQPDISEKIEKGTLNLTNLGVVTSVIRAKAREGSREGSREGLVKQVDVSQVISLVENRSKREAELALIKGGFVEKHELRPERLSGNELKISISHEFEQKLNRLKNLMAHSDPNISIGQLFEKLIDQELQRITRAIQKRSSIKRKVWSRDKGRCTNCESEYALEVDHVIPRAKGGDDSIENLRLLCRSCNQRSAIDEFGQLKMDRYLA